MNKELYKGLTSKQAEESRRLHGSNILTPPKKESLFKRFMQTLTGPLGHLIPGWQDGDSLVFILELAAILSTAISFSEYYGWLGMPVSPDGAKVFFEPAGIIMAIILATGISFLAEVKAEREFEVLNQVNDDEPVTVIRDGSPTRIAKKDVVVGDVIILSTGDEVPADAVLHEATRLSIDESSLTGEPITTKSVSASSDSTATYPENHVYRGTKVMEGHAVAEVYAVGDSTENGKAFTAAKIEDGKSTPLDEQLKRLGILISIASVAVGILVFVGRVALYLHTDDTVSMPEIIANILQSLMLAVTLVVCAVPEGLPMAVTMSLAYSMRRMLKTNNLVRKIHACETMGATTVICTDKTGTLTQNRMQVADALYREDDADALRLCMAVNSTAMLDGDSVLGNPTEGALLLWLRERGVDYAALRDSCSIAAEEPFSTETKYMSMTLSDGTRLVKGAPEVVMAMCADFDIPRDEAEERLRQWQKRAMRTLAFACGSGASLKLIGLVAISDPVRDDVTDAIQTCQRAGIRVIMVTGDNRETAREIGRQIGLNDIDNDIVARARPLDKRHLVEQLQQQDEVVAVTGDGTNDAPALKAAHVGLSMGAGTSVAKEASDITIIDNSFASICRAVMWGRSLYINIQRFILFQLTVNITACLVVMVGSFITPTPPLTVTQMLWVNLIMDTFAAVALASLPPSAEVMNSKPRNRYANIIDRSMAVNLIGTSLYFSALMLALLCSLHPFDGTERAIFFTSFIMLQFWNLFCAKGFKANGEMRFKGARAFILIAVIIFLGQWLIVTVAYNFFNIAPLPPLTMLYVVAATAVAVAIKHCFIRLAKF